MPNILNMKKNSIETILLVFSYRHLRKAAILFIFVFFINKAFAQLNDLGIAQIRPDVQTGFSNGGWKYDQFKNLKSLDAHTSIVIADLKGPGVIRLIHTTRHSPKDLFTRGIVIEIWFDNAKEPAVNCPLGDFFGDGCNGNSMDFTSLFLECAPWSYNCYIPMPFKSRARVILRNDTNKDAMNYSFVEWESLPKWDKNLGYFHATYARKCFQLTKDSKVTFFETKGMGQIIGRQFSINTDDKYFRDFNTVMEGNNEVDIDGQKSKVDYLGTEDSFTFSWGFNNTFAGLRAGMPFIEKGTDTTLDRLSVYRFEMPIRYTKSIKWSIDWRYETYFIKRKEWPEKVKAGGCWVDYATVFYWYSDAPGGYKHQTLLPVDERQKDMLHYSSNSEHR